MDFNISTGKVHTAVKTVIYGAEGIGKTTLAAQFPSPLFMTPREARSSST